jgi:hypothetical protein
MVEYVWSDEKLRIMIFQSFYLFAHIKQSFFRFNYSNGIALLGIIETLLMNKLGWDVTVVKLQPDVKIAEKSTTKTNEHYLIP